MVHLSRSEQKRISSQKKPKHKRSSPSSPYNRNKQEVNQYIERLNRDWTGDTK